MARRIQWRRDTEANWTADNPTLAMAEIGYETDTLKLKVGDGVTAWNSLAYGLGQGIVNMYTDDQFPTEMTEKTTILADDVFILESDADGGAKRYVKASNFPAGVDTTAIHKATPAEISVLTEKGSPVAGDWLLIEDSADSNNKKKIAISNLPTGSDTDAVHVNEANEITAITAKTTPVSADVIIIEDSEDSFNKKKLAVSDFPGGVDVSALHKATANEIALMSEAVPADADQLVCEDQSDSWNKKRLTLSAVAAYTIGKIGLFSVTKDGDQQTTSTTYEDAVNWDTPTINTAGITVNSGLGTFTFANAGTYELTYNCTNDQTLNSNRNKSHHQLVLDGTQIKGTYGVTYNRNSTDGASHVSCNVIISVTANQVLKMQFRTDNATYGQSILEDSTALTIKRWS